MKFNLAFRTLRSLILAFTFFYAANLGAQSSNCATATPITLSSGSACVGGTNVGATPTTYTGSGCPSGTINGVWYTYTTNGSNNTFTVTPGTMTNPMVLITFSCPNPTLIIETCASTTGSTPATTTWGTTTGQQVYIYVASMGGTNGTFTLCVNSQPPAPGAGNTCSQAIPICDMNTFTQASVPNNSSGQNPNCFGSPPQQDIWYTFTITQNGTLAWQCIPNNLSTEFDWCLWDVSAGCPGTVACCNYHYAGGSSNGFGMQAVANTGACGISSLLGNANKEYCNPIAVVCGKTYAIQISNYSNDNVGFSFDWTGSTCMVGSNATFTVSPTLICGASLIAAITDGSTGDCAAVWTYGDGTTYTGATPPNHTYNTSGTYAITETIGGACPSSHTEFVELLGPLAATVAATPPTCTGMCNGSATLSAISGGDGIYTYTWSPGGNTATSISSLCAGTYSITIHNVKCNSTLTQTVNIVAPPGPTVTVNSPTICKGASTTLTATGATTYSWSPSTGLSATTGASVSANPTVTTTYTVVGTTGACTGTATAVVTVNPTPTVIVNSPTLCSGNSTPLTANGANTYTWTPPATLSASTGSVVTASPTVTTTYTITGTSAAGCTATATSTVTVNPTPTVTVNSPTICVGASSTLTAAGASTYTWSPGTGLSGTTGATVTANPTVTTVYTITATSVAGCTATAISTVTVNPTPTITVNSPTICPGGSATLTATGANTYTWTPAATLSSSTGASVTATPTVTTTYTITGTSAAGCTATATATVTIGGSIVPTVNNATICVGNSAPLTASGGITYTWSPGTGLSSTSAATVTANPTVTTTYTLTAASGGCTGTTTAAVTVNPLPTVTVNSPSLCVGNSATLTAAGASTYTWSPGTGLSSTTGASVTATPTVTTTYMITGTSAAGCTTTATSTVTVNPTPTITVNNATYCTGGSATLTASGASTYTWSPATGLSSTSGASVTANPTVTTNYTITGASAAGCVNTATTSVTVVTSPTVSANTATICVGNSTTLNASGAVTYTWSPATGLSSTTGATVTANPASTTVYTITGATGTCSATGTTTVTVNPLPTVTATSGTICVGQQTATLIANGATSYTWNPSTGLSSPNGSVVTANPGASVNYTITGADGNGCTNTGTATVTVNPLPNVNVNSGLICLGNSMTLTANGATTYSWSPPGGLSGTTGASVTASPVATTVYTVTGTDASGCTNPATSTVTVANNPTITATTGTICAGQGTSTLTASGANTFTWSPATGLSSTTGSVVNASPGVTQIYTITGSIGTCTASGTTTVTVNPSPTVTATSGAICVGQQTATLTANGATSYTWNPATGLSSPNGTVVTANPGATTNYTITGTDGNGCTNTGTATVTVNPLPVVTATGTTVCVGQTINLSSLPNGAASYSWADPFGFTISQQNPSIPNAATAMAGTYTVTVIDGSGCQNSNTATVAVNSLPVVSANSATICAGQTTATLTASGANTYVWAPATGLSGTTGASVTASPANTATYVVTGTDLNNCQNAATVTLTANPPPVISISPQNASGCAPKCVAFSNSTTATGICAWTFGDGSTDATCNPKHCFNVQGSYNVTLTLTDANGCKGTSNAAVTIFPVPHADFYGSPQPATILEPSVQFYDASSGAVIANWNWSFGDYSTTSISPLANPVHIYGDTGSYYVQLLVISNQGCRDSVIKIIRIDDDYAMYVPNAFSPNSDGTNDIFKAVGFGVRDFKMYVFDRWGNQVFFSDNLEKGWDGRMHGKGDETVQEDVYVWKIEARTTKNVKKTLAGVVNLLK